MAWKVVGYSKLQFKCIAIAKIAVQDFQFFYLEQNTQLSS